jgi:outer membrane protein assembly factor BamE (lipoprotein component of BamABCDE complex)
MSALGQGVPIQAIRELEQNTMSAKSKSLHRMRRQSAAVAAAFALGLGLAGCSSTVTRHGHLFQETDLQQIQPGMSAEQVKLSLGTPTTTSTVGAGNAFYYMSSTKKETAFLSPTETDRQVVAVYFNKVGSVERVANYGMKDGKVFDTISRTTPSANTNDDGILKSLFRNLGQKGSIFSDG